MNKTYQKLLFSYLIFSFLFLSFRVATEVFQRYSIYSTITEDYLSFIDGYCIRNDLNWKLSFPCSFCYTNYHYWSTLFNMVNITESGKTIAQIRSTFQAKWFGVYLKKIEIILPGNSHCCINITEDFLLGNMKHPDDYYEEYSLHPYTKPSVENSKNWLDSPFFLKYLFYPFYIFIIFTILFCCGWIAWLTGYSWYLFFKTKDWIPRNIRIKAYFYLILLPVSIGLLIVSAVTAELGGKQFFALNMIIIFIGLILYLIESASICRLYKGIHLSAKATPDDNSGNSKFNNSY